MRILIYLKLLLLILLITAQPAVAQESVATPVAVEANETPAEEVDILPVDAVLLGEEEDNGVSAFAYLYKVTSTDTATSRSSNAPYLLFLRFIGKENNIVIKKGLTAFKLEDYTGTISPAKKMDLKNGYFVSPLEKPKRSYYTLHIGCKLEDDKKRQFRYKIRLK